MFSCQLNPKALQRIARQPSQLVKTLCSFQNEHHVFDRSPRPTLKSIHHSMLNFIHQSQFEALKVFKKQFQMGVSEIDEVAIALALKACKGDLTFGSQLHSLTIRSGFFSYITVPNSLMNMYCKSGQFSHAMLIFEDMENPDTVSYNTVLSGCENGGDALCFAHRMHALGVTFDAVSYTTALSHCTAQEMFIFGSQLHSCVMKSGLEFEIFIGNALVTMYLKWGKIVEAERVFCEMPSKDLVSWNALLSGYAQEGSYALEAILGFIEMVREGMKPDHVSLTSAVSACGQQRDLEFGKQIHGFAIKRAYGTHVSVCNVLMALYSKSGDINDAKMIFQRMTERNVVSWTTMLSMSEEDAMAMFNEMRRNGVYPNDVTFVGLIHALTMNNMISEGCMVHGFCMKSNFFSELNVVNCFITMYGKFGFMEDSRKVFEELDHKDIISWNALISGYAQNGMYQDALQIFSSTIMESRPNEYTFGSVLSAIASSESISLKHGLRCHSCLVKLGLNTNPVTFGALLDMYAKRGSIFESQRVFHEIAEKGQVSWTAMISAHSRHGDYESVISLFEEMKQKGVKPDSITFLSVLTACGHKGIVDVGIEIFNSMTRDFSIKPSAEHYSCVVDMLGRAGRLNEAEQFMSRIPGGPGISVLQSLLGSCRTHGNVEMAKRVGEALIALEPEHSGSYVLMSNLYAEKGQWEKVANIRKGMRSRGVKKEVAFSWVDVGSIDDSLNLHGFSSDDKSHPLSEEIYRMVEWLGSEMKHLEEDEDDRYNRFVACGHI
nr:pentatricopeptide repeat-containing protein At4g32430, mitochondrial [Ipomoea batatas]